MADGIEVKVDTKNLKTIENVLSSMASRGCKLQPLMRKLGTQMLRIVDRNFEAEGRPAKWKKRSPISQVNLAIGAQGRASKTKRFEKAKQRGKASILRRESLKAMGNKILSQSGDLKNSIIFEADDLKVTVGPADHVKYARIHQLGGVIRPTNKQALFVPCGKRMLRLKKVTIPARPYLLVPQSEVPKLANIAKDELAKQAQKEIAKRMR